MKKLWIKCSQLKCSRELQMHVFLFINILFWLLAGFLLSALMCLFFGIEIREGLEKIIIFTGYAGLIMGWFGGLFFLLRQDIQEVK